MCLWIHNILSIHTISLPEDISEKLYPSYQRNVLSGYQQQFCGPTLIPITTILIFTWSGEYKTSFYPHPRPGHSPLPAETLKHVFLQPHVLLVQAGRVDIEKFSGTCDTIHTLQSDKSDIGGVMVRLHTFIHHHHHQLHQPHYSQDDLRQEFLILNNLVYSSSSSIN